MRKKKPRLHLVYAVPSAKKLRMLTGNHTPLYRKYWRYFLLWRKPVPAPFSITYKILQHLSANYEILLYDVNERLTVELQSTDRFIGHCWPSMQTKEDGNNNWTSFDSEQVTNRAILNYPNDERVFCMTPFNHSTEQLGWAVPLMNKVNCYVGICGDFWIDKIDDSAFSFLKPKMTHLNMGIEKSNYPRVKKTFNPKGRRKFLYIGRISKEKNIEMLEAIASNCLGFEGGYIGDGIIKGWKQIAPKARLTQTFMQSLANEYDFFINTSTFDAQATTVLEAMSWGFVVACTPETGYIEPGVFQLSKDDIQANIQVIDTLNYLDENELTSIADQYQVLLDKKFTWQVFTNRLKTILNHQSN